MLSKSDKFFFLETICNDKNVLPVYGKCMIESYGEYVIHQAAIEGKLELIKFLHKKGFVLNKMDQNGETPMLLAALKGQWNIVYYLHDKIRDEKKKTKNKNHAFLRVL